MAGTSSPHLQSRLDLHQPAPSIINRLLSGFSNTAHWQHAYSLAFKRAGLVYGGTHNFRPGGCQLIYDRSGGDQALAGQLLGNEDSDTVKIYARRDKKALRNVAQKEWDAMC